MGSRQFCRGREVEAEARQGSNVLNRSKAEAESSIEAEARQTKFEARPRRGDPPPKKTSFPRCIAIAVQNLVVLSQTV